MQKHFIDMNDIVTANKYFEMILNVIRCEGALSAASKWRNKDGFSSDKKGWFGN
jgi:hypothetical protein